MGTKEKTEIEIRVEKNHTHIWSYLCRILFNSFLNWRIVTVKLPRTKNLSRCLACVRTIDLEVYFDCENLNQQ